MQATVKHFDGSTGSGSVLFDDGRELGFSADAFALSGLLALRPGQRVRLRMSSDGTVAALTISTLALPDGLPG
ncbi:MAG: hypothetical protein QOG52_2125 [Frankiaceae bacterium]|jgi:cold shock CspA family protein|nr:hypothetical protein [Frankiaceae bacterium]